MIKVLLPFLLVFFVVIPGHSEVGVPIFVKGKVLDEFTKKPVNVQMMFTDKDGKKFKIVPNSITGAYEQVLNSGEDYDVTFISFDVVRESFKLHLDYSTKYIEVEKEFLVKRMTNGLELYSENVFQKNSAELLSEGKELLDKLIKALRFSRGAKLQLNVSGEDSDGSDNVQQLINSRIQTINNYSGLAEIKSRITISAAEANTDKNLTVIVTEISDPLTN